MSDYSKMSNKELTTLIYKSYGVCVPYSDYFGIGYDHADNFLVWFIGRESEKLHYWNCAQELVLEQLNGVQVYMRKATLFRGVAPDGVCYSVKRDNAARALTEVILMALDGMK